jgi:integrase
MTNNNKFNFTKLTLDALRFPAKGKRAYYYDIKTRGLGIAITSAGTKSFIVYRKVKGTPERITLGRYPDMTIEQARGKAAAVNATIAQGENPADQCRANRAEMTLEALKEEYLKRCADFNKRPDKPRNNYRLYLSHWSKRKLSSIKPHEVQALHGKIGREHGKVTANIALKLLYVMFNKAINEWRIWKGDNPAHGIKKFPEKSRDRFLQADELPKFLQAVSAEPNDAIRDYILLSLLTGARKANVLAMRWEEINFERCEWRIPDTKNGTPQTIPLMPEALEILKARLKRYGDSSYVFSGIGKTGHLMEPKKGWDRILKSAGITELRIHDLRRTLGSWQARTGASLTIIGKSLNHKSPQATAIYARLDLDPVRASMEKATSAMLAAGVNPIAEGELVP